MHCMSFLSPRVDIGGSKTVCYAIFFLLALVSLLICRVQSVSAIAWVFDSCKSITISGASLQAIWTVYTHVHGHHVHQNDQCAAGSHLTSTVHDT